MVLLLVELIWCYSTAQHRCTAEMHSTAQLSIDATWVGWIFHWFDVVALACWQLSYHSLVKWWHTLRQMVTNTNIAKPTVPMLTVMGGSVLTPKSLGICRQHMKGNGKSKMLTTQCWKTSRAPWEFVPYQLTQCAITLSLGFHTGWCARSTDTAAQLDSPMLPMPGYQEPSEVGYRMFCSLPIWQTVCWDAFALL